jgi:four helix bundle protein
VAFDHERLDVYRIALDLLVLTDDTLEHLPRGRSHLADQLSRASTSIVLNIAEGAGKYSRADKRRYYLTAIGSATESAAIFDILLRLRLTSPERHAESKAALERIVSMLTKLAKNLQQSPTPTTE